MDYKNLIYVKLIIYYHMLRCSDETMLNKLFLSIIIIMFHFWKMNLYFSLIQLKKSCYYQNKV